MLTEYNNMVGRMGPCGIKIRPDLFVYLEILLRFYINGYIWLKDALTVKYDRRKINAL